VNRALKMARTTTILLICVTFDIYYAKLEECLQHVSVLLVIILLLVNTALSIEIIVILANVFQRASVRSWFVKFNPRSGAPRPTMFAVVMSTIVVLMLRTLGPLVLTLFPNSCRG